MRTAGRLIRGGRSSAVRGTSNYHHLWGFTPGFLFANVAYLTFTLEDGRDILVGFARAREEGPEFEVLLGYAQQRSGEVRRLRRGEFSLRPRRFWSPDPTCRYPVGWDVDVLGTRLRADAVHDASEIRTTDPRVLSEFPEWPRIWDGATSLTGDAEGRGWLDLTHYCYV
jgi:predicted secreted hydrolase